LGNLGAYFRNAARRILTEYFSPFAGQIAHHVAEVFFFDKDGQVHNRFEQSGICLPHRVAESVARGQLKRQFRRINGMVLAVYNLYLDIDNGITCHSAVRHAFQHALFHAGDVVLRE